MINQVRQSSIFLHPAFGFHALLPNNVKHPIKQTTAATNFTSRYVDARRAGAG